MRMCGVCCVYVFMCACCFSVLYHLHGRQLDFWMVVEGGASYRFGALFKHTPTDIHVHL